MSVHYRKGPDHHWMTLLGLTKPNWSWPPAANGPERNSPGWVMTVFSAFLFRLFWCPVPPTATSPVPCVPFWSSPLISCTLAHTSTQHCWTQRSSARCAWQQMTNQSLRLTHICVFGALRASWVKGYLVRLGTNLHQKHNLAICFNESPELTPKHTPDSKDEPSLFSYDQEHKVNLNYFLAAVLNKIDKQ